MRQSVVLITISIVLAACALAPDHAGVPLAPTAPAATQPACQPALTQPSNNGFPEIQATTKSAVEIWALLFFDQTQARQDAKIVWRVTGTGQLTVQAQQEDGTIIQPIWGPEYHGGSNWDRPGDEWGTGFNFPEPGCWTLTVTRGEATGEIRLEVVAP